MNELLKALGDLGTPRVLVVGDLMLDRDTAGVTSRVSPEAPAMVLTVEREDVRPGGAASVANLLRGLDAIVELVGVVGDGADGRLLRRLVTDAGVRAGAILVDGGRPTTVKERFLGRVGTGEGRQILRVDRESQAPLAAAQEGHLCRAVGDALGGCRAVLVSDYGKGTCTPGLISTIRRMAQRSGIAVLVDPARGGDCERYRGVDLLKPNRFEAESVVGRPIRTRDEALAAARALRELFEIGAVLVTLDRDGSALVYGDGEDRLPARSQAVRDVTGAGDMVLATMGLCRAAGLPWVTAAGLANVAAGLEVERRGVAPVSRAEIGAALGEEPVAPTAIVEKNHVVAAVATNRVNHGPIVPAVRKLILCNRQSAGDCMVMTAALECLHQQHPGRFVTAVRCACPAVFEHNPHVAADPDNAAGWEQIEMHYTDAINRCNQENIHFMEGYTEYLAKRLGVALRLSVNRPYLYFSPDEGTWMSRVQELYGEDLPHWLVCAGTKRDYTAKGWITDYYQEVVDRLKDRILFVQIGHPDHIHPSLTNVCNQIGKTNLRELIRLCRSARGGLGPVTFIQHAFAALGKPYVCIAGGREPPSFTAYNTQTTLHTIGALPCCRVGCWRSRVVPLGDGDHKDRELCSDTIAWNGSTVQRCMSLIKPAEAAAAIERYLS